MNKYIYSALFGALLVGAAPAVTIAAPPVPAISAPSTVEKAHSRRYVHRHWRPRYYGYRHHYRGKRYAYRWYRKPRFGIYVGPRYRYGHYWRHRYY